MFRRISPQKVQHICKKYIVQSKDRYHMEYIDEQFCVEIEVDTGVNDTVIYKDGLCSTNKVLTDLERELIIKRVSKGLKAMGTKLVIIE